jgi:3-hydroxybutyryl-CoA dehydrogenase
LEIRQIAVLGAGLMGHGIAQVAAQVGGYRVWMRDIEDRFIDSGMKMISDSLQRFVRKNTLTESAMKETLSRIHATVEMKQAVQDADLIIEAVPEILQIKRDVYREVEKYAKRDAYIVSNTSSISITALASATNRPERFCGMHFFNPPQLMSLVEIIRGAKTAEETVQLVRQVSERMGKQTVVVKKDTPGFIVNRILVPALNEAIGLIHEGVADIEDVDKAVTLGLNWPMGPLRLLDYVGLDTTLNISEVLVAETGDQKYRPSLLLRQMVRAGLLGRKTGKGFYDWTK